jgi:hypothetical protein
MYIHSNWGTREVCGEDRKMKVEKLEQYVYCVAYVTHMHASPMSVTKPRLKDPTIGARQLTADS